MQQGQHDITSDNMSRSLLLAELEQEDQNNWLVTEPAEIHTDNFIPELGLLDYH
ncbi:hypothetical protein [Vibrio intestinalis]|uniref:hypothetical protein n=1 Tax=Vibrio intestinalis TaxID=2933291 RepID=UPI0021A57758|nr:hypothetical protein [Vibrio intestinalis]